MKKLALPFAVLSLGTLTYACSGGNGGGNAGEPCCGATGETVPPSSGFAFAGGAASDRFAQVVVLDTSSTASCPTISAGSLDLTPTFIAEASDPRRVEADGRFSLEIFDEVEDASLVGRQLFVRVYDGTPDNTRGMGSLSGRTSEGADVPVAPILFDAAAFGESTVEGLIACLFQTASAQADQFQNMTLADVRAFVTEDMARALQSGGEGGIHNTTKSWRHGINGLHNVVVATNGSSVFDFVALRNDAESFADRCKLRDPSSPADCAAQNDARIRARLGDSYRFWYLVRNALAYDITWDSNVEAIDPATRRIMAFAEDSMVELLQIDSDNVLDESNPVQVAAFRNNQLLRFEIAQFALRRAFTCYGSINGPGTNGECTDGTLDPALDVTSAGTATTYESLDDSLAALSTVLTSANPTLTDIENAWAAFATDVAFNFGLQVDPVAYTDQGGNQYSDAVTLSQNQATAIHFDLILDGTQHQVETTRNIDWTNEAIRARLYDSTNTETSSQGMYDSILAATSIFSSATEPEPGTVADVLFYSHVNVRP